MRRWCAFFAFLVRHVVFLEGVYLDRTEAGLKPRFIKGEPPSDADIAEVLQKISRRVIRIGSGFGYEGKRPALTGPRCASVSGFSLHANPQVPAPRRDQLERLMRYTARGAVALERLAEDAHGDRVDTFTKPWSDGTTGMTLAPLALLEKLAAIVPLPPVPLVRYAGC